MTLSTLTLFSVIAVLLLRPSTEVIFSFHHFLYFLNLWYFLFVFLYSQFPCQDFLFLFQECSYFLVKTFLIAILKSLSFNSNISVILMLMSLDFIFLRKLWLSWLFVKRVTFYCTMDILSITLWDSESYIFFFLARNCLGYIGVRWLWRFTAHCCLLTPEWGEVGRDHNAE